jgi:hypothetical protein
MNCASFNRLMEDVTITLSCKSWLWLRQFVFESERFRRWHGHHKFPFYDPEFSDSALQFPPNLILNGEQKLEFYSYCEFWYEKCIFNDIFEIQNGLPLSDGGLGLVCLHDVSDLRLKETVLGVLEFVDEELFLFLRLNDYSSLYVTNEGDFCILIGPLALCNNGRTVENFIRFPTLTDRGWNDEELMYDSFRREFINLQQTGGFIHVEFEHYAIEMDVRFDTLRLAGSQILVDYGFVTVVVVNLIE